MKILVASKNPIKIESTKNSFLKFYKDISIEGVESKSGVSSQPLSKEETLLGAKNRVDGIMAQHKDYDYYVGIEGGVTEDFNKWFEFGAIYIVDSKNRNSIGFHFF